METAHTPTPWVSRGKATIAALPESKYQGAPSVVYIATLEQGVDREANRGFLLRAVNCHDDLVAALKEAIEELNVIRPRWNELLAKAEAQS